MLDEEKFWQWFKENSPLCGKMKTMEKICKAFPETTINTKRPFPPYGYGKYSNEAAVLMNLWKEEGKITTEKRGRSYCYIIVESDKK